MAKELTMKAIRMVVLATFCLLIAACETSSGFSMSLGSSDTPSSSFGSNGESSTITSSVSTTSDTVSSTSIDDSSDAYSSDISSSSSSSLTTSSSYEDSSSILTSSDNGEYPTIEEVLLTLYNDGYVDLEVMNTPMLREGRQSYLNTTYGLSVAVIGFYEGYVPEHTRWVRIHNLDSVINAMYVYNAFAADNPDFHHLDRLGTVVIETESYATWALFHPE
jgi:hypothetical protein